MELMNQQKVRSILRCENLSCFQSVALAHRTSPFSEFFVVFHCVSSLMVALVVLSARQIAQAKLFEAGSVAFANECKEHIISFEHAKGRRIDFLHGLIQALALMHNCDLNDVHVFEACSD
jgi:hypothetical protein